MADAVFKRNGLRAGYTSEFFGINIAEGLAMFDTDQLGTRASRRAAIDRVLAGRYR